MVHKCVVGGCPNNSDIIIHYILPLDPKRRSRWIEFIEGSKDGGEKISSSSRVCGDHFSRDDFTRQDLGFTTHFILGIDAIPSVYANSCTSKDGHDAETTVDEVETDETCNITISETVSLACIKEELSDCEISPTLNLLEDQPDKSESGRHIKQEESKDSGSDQLELSPSASVKSSSGRRALKSISEDNPEKPFSCSDCGAKFRNKGVLMQHESGHLDGKIRAYHCSQCGKSFSHRSILKAHQKLHLDVGPRGVYSCSVCSRQFCYKGSLESHMKQHLSQETTKNFQCPICDEVYQSKAAISQHVKTSHGKSKLVCKICNAGFPRLESFFKHMDRHEVETPYFCSLCKVYQLTKRGYLCHMRIHEKKRLLTDAANKDRVDAGENDRVQVVELKQNDRGIYVRPDSELANEERGDSTEKLVNEAVARCEEIEPVFLESDLSLMETSFTDTSEDFTDVK